MDIKVYGFKSSNLEEDSKSFTNMTDAANFVAMKLIDNKYYRISFDGIFPNVDSYKYLDYNEKCYYNELHRCINRKAYFCYLKLINK